jgi:hypothetical protein
MLPLAYGRGSTRIAPNPLRAAGADGRDGDDGPGGAEYGPPWPEQGEVGASRQGAAGQVHDLLVTDIAVREHPEVDGVLADERLEGLFRLDRNAIR